MSGALRALLLLLLAGCRGEGQGRCQGPEDCPPSFTCVIEGGLGFCGCADDSACAEGEVCNPQRRCQRRPRCRSNVDCPEGQICGEGACVPSEVCRSDPQCPLGAFCAQGRCQEGCRDDGDCPLYQACLEGRCQLHCRDSSGCALGSRCVGGRCYSNTNPSHCAECSESRACPWHTDFCLINSGHDPARPETGSARFCGVDCAEDPALCPNGYSCNEVVLLTEDECERDIQCGSAQRRCVLREGEPRGFCTCLRDRDCTQQTVPRQCTAFGLCLSPAGRLCGRDADCDPLPLCGQHGEGPQDICWNQPSLQCSSATDCLCEQGRCINTNRACQLGADCVLSCINGGCFVGRACAPLEGLSCPALKP